jgi:hydrogenase maturation protease
VILIDSAKFGGAAGDIRLFRKHEILSHPPRARMDPHSPAMSESISLLELMGVMPREFLMIGMQGGCFAPGSSLSTPVRLCIPHIIDAVRRELHRLNLSCVPKASVKPPAPWWDSLRPKTVGRA